MPRAETRLSEAEKEAWAAFCKENHVSEATMLRKMIMRITEGRVPIKSLVYKPAKSNQLKFRLGGDTLARLDKRAEQEGYQNRTQWAKATILGVLHQEPVLTDTEVEALNESTRQLGAIGRNLNQVARALNIEFRESDKIKREAIEALSERITEHIDHIDELFTRNMNRWGNDG